MGNRAPRLGSSRGRGSIIIPWRWSLYPQDFSDFRSSAPQVTYYRLQISPLRYLSESLSLSLSLSRTQGFRLERTCTPKDLSASRSLISGSTLPAQRPRRRQQVTFLPTLVAAPRRRRAFHPKSRMLMCGTLRKPGSKAAPIGGQRQQEAKTKRLLSSWARTAAAAPSSSTG